ncbi:DUF5627 domain-containing protein [Plebeiibacterium sediminum]|uniref:DUF5627 domain-containing protein n=1 Tax=Plebeiibacterium sediminum TaxID=2992112 RepID=A0AAE3M308_9BACT|nr:DUF5627 domain-containing protein [Plebeiobacterium sediminum]MCW3785830.1 DUF5627 domain-containing protein [Plebeiobacterium sediminum]
MKIHKILLAVFIAGVLFSCDNEDVSYPDFDYTTVYFANQSPIRTLELGEDPQVDNTIDNERKVKITATMGGVYANSKDRTINIVVDETLCEGLSYTSGSSELVAMPSSYYNLASNQITIKAGEILGGVEVQLTPDFFADPLALDQHYVIPLVMTDVANADSILSGKPLVENPDRFIAADWELAPKDYVLYGIKYVNQYHANYLRRGEDVISDGVSSVTDIRREEYVERDELVSVSTLSLTECSLPVSIKEDDNETTRANIELLLAFDDNNNCTVSSNSSSYTVSGTGKFVTDGEKNSMGGYDRDALYLDYTVELTDLGYTYATKDTLVCRNRGVAPEYRLVSKE